MKTNRKTKTSATFTRSEFMLFSSLLDVERETPLARTNARYAGTLKELQERVDTIGDPEWGHVTDAVEVTL